MKYQASLAKPTEKELYIRLFDVLAGHNLLLDANPPYFTMLAVTPQRLKEIGMTKEAVIGKHLFDVHPGNSADRSDNGAANLRSSLEHVLRYKETHHLPIQRYDLPDENGVFSERYWRASNRPVLSAEGEVLFIIHTAEDITTELKAAQREIQVAGFEKVFSLFMHAPMVMGLANGDNHVLEMANEAAFKLWGKRPEEIIGKSLLEGLPELAGQGIIELFDQVRATGKPYAAYEVPVTSLVDGRSEQHYFNLIYQPYFDQDNTKVTGVFTISHDVTEQVVAKQKAEESEAKFRTMAESTPVLIAVGDETGQVTYYNNAWTELTGKAVQNMLDAGWVDLIHADDKENFASIFFNAFAVKGRFNAEFRVLDIQGRVRWLLGHGMPRFSADGRFMGYIAACTDITELKTVQQQLQTALEQVRLSKEAAELGTFDMDLERGTMHWDDRCRILFGISHPDPVTYEKDFVQGLHPQDRDRIVKLIDQLFIKSISNGDYDVEYRTVGAEDGVIRWVRAKGKVYFDAQEKPVRFIGSVLDITEKVTALQKIEAIVEERTRELAEANENLQQSNKELQRSNQNLEEFAHAASHDLKEPIRKIHFFTHQLKHKLAEQLKEPELRSFSRIEEATRRMGNLIDDLLLYSHVSHRPHETETVDLRESVQQVLEDLDLEVEEKKATLQVGELPRVKGYRRQLQQLLQNLVSNALKYSKANERPHIEIMAEEAHKSGQSYHLVILKDNGIGFDPVYAERIFQMFARLHGKAEYSGTGVGLSIVKKVVENHNGFIEVESAVGKGSTFKIYLPA